MNAGEPLVMFNKVRAQIAMKFKYLKTILFLVLISDIVHFRPELIVMYIDHGIWKIKEVIK